MSAPVFLAPTSSETTPWYVEYHIDIYGTDLFCVTTKKQWKQLRKRLPWIGRVPSGVGQVSSAPSENTVVIWLKPHDNPAEHVDTCGHEASHAAGRILQSIGHNVDATDEPHAYLCGWITRWLWENTQ